MNLKLERLKLFASPILTNRNIAQHNMENSQEHKFTKQTREEIKALNKKKKELLANADDDVFWSITKAQPQPPEGWKEQG